MSRIHSQIQKKQLKEYLVASSKKQVDQRANGKAIVESPSASVQPYSIGNTGASIDCGPTTGIHIFASEGQVKRKDDTCKSILQFSHFNSSLKVSVKDGKICNGRRPTVVLVGLLPDVGAVL